MKERNAKPHQKVSRRFFLQAGTAFGATVVASQFGGCAYPTQAIAAYDPWDFPGNERRKEFLCAKAAILAASPHNSQPWLFTVTSEYVEVHADLRKSLKSIDSFHREMYIGLGCAIENGVIAARKLGLSPRVEYFPSPGTETHVATIHFTQSSPNAELFYSIIPKRHTNRGNYSQAKAPTGLGAALRSHIQSESDVSLTLLTDRNKMKHFKEQVVAATKAIVNDKEMYEDSDRWWRQDKNDINKHRDGLTFDANVSSAGIRFLGKLTPQVSTEASGNFWIESVEQEAMTGSAYGILSTPDRYNRLQQLQCGRVWQRIALWARSVNMATQPQNQLAERWDREDQLNLPSQYKNHLQSWIDSEHKGGQMVFRIGYPLDKVLKAPRRPLQWVLL